jgi:hypothetical protein
VRCAGTAMKHTKHDDAQLLVAESPWETCPRAALVKVLGVAESKFGFKFRVGYESEFMLLKAAEPGSAVPFRPVDNSVYASSSALNDMAPGKHRSEDGPSLPYTYPWVARRVCVLRGITGALRQFPCM